MTDLSGVTAVQGVNNANGMRMAFDEANAQGGVHGRKIRFIVEDMEYIVPKAVQAMNKLLNRDNIFFAVGNGGTPMNDAVMPSMFEKNVPNVFPADLRALDVRAVQPAQIRPVRLVLRSDARGGETFRASKGVKTIGAMYQDTDYGRDVLAGAQAQVEAMGLKLGGTTGHKPTDTDFNAAIAKLRDADCDLIVMGTIVKDTVIILQTAHKQGWNPISGQLRHLLDGGGGSARRPGGGFFSMSPAPYRYPGRPAPGGACVRGEVQADLWDRCELSRRGRLYRGELLAGGAGEGRARPDARQLHRRYGEHEGLARHLRGPPLSLSPTNHHASNQSFLSVVKDARWVPVVQEPLSF